MTTSAEENSAASAALFQNMANVSLAQSATVTYAIAATPASNQTIQSPQKLRRRGSANLGAPTAQVRLVEDSQGLLHWDYESTHAERGLTTTGIRGSSARGQYRASQKAGSVVASTTVAEIGVNKVNAALEGLDRLLTPRQGLRQYADGILREDYVAQQGLKLASRILLFIHGTFSKGDMYFEEFAATTHGLDFLKAIEKKYSHVVSFDHPTLHVSPVLNAIDLEFALSQAELDSSTPIDVICHSRGGLVASWWLRTTKFKVERMVAVASPLQGTSLASPYRIRYLLDYFANFSKVISMGLASAAAVPSFASSLMMGASGLAGVLGGVTGAFSATPFADAAIGLVPGLNSMSRVSNNGELNRLWNTPSRSLASVKTFVITSDYAPAVGTEALTLWERIRKMPWQVAHNVSEKLFPGSNDMVVDTSSMYVPSSSLVTPTGLQVLKDDRFEFQREHAVHHCNYFAHERTVDRLTTWFELAEGESNGA
ncbi:MULTISPECIES: triacylglycerol lipase [unclassified Caballeronia]|uniref:esterase/lipase family protein n=1 Tax=unclassified Caballeronia TaxID=2646786 RepID=UPI0002D699D7|nr:MULTISPECIES: hypothetical protein [unclassified Caballeronia]MCE4546446.1 hypothetical protein [Caballeronia sp. PC1]MCE4573081.1 hypothetical protein [Caballeronia sp. CLC5]